MKRKKVENPCCKECNKGGIISVSGYPALQKAVNKWAYPVKVVVIGENR